MQTQSTFGVILTKDLNMIYLLTSQCYAQTNVTLFIC